MKKMILLFLIIPTLLFAQEDITWDYPVKPGSEEWLNISNYLKRLEQLNIPSNVLSEISTYQLVKTCLNYPQIELVFTRSNLIEGISYVSVHFNGFKELLKKKRCGV